MQAQGEATAIRVIAEATAAGVRAVARTSNTLIVPASASDVAGFVATAMTVLDKTRHAQAAAKA
jgi:hypothetical protein